MGVQGGAILIPGLCLPKALQPLLPIFLQVFIFALLYGLIFVGCHRQRALSLCVPIRQCLHKDTSSILVVVLELSVSIFSIFVR